MTGKNKKLIGAIFIIAITLVTGFLWLSLRPVTIIAVHHRSSGFSDVLVNHFPFTTKGKIAWWQKFLTSTHPERAFAIVLLLTSVAMITTQKKTLMSTICCMA